MGRSYFSSIVSSTLPAIACSIGREVPWQLMKNSVEYVKCATRTAQMPCALRSSSARMMSSTIGREGSSSSGPSGSRRDEIGLVLGIWKELRRCVLVPASRDWNCIATRSGGARRLALAHGPETARRTSRAGG